MFNNKSKLNFHANILERKTKTARKQKSNYLFKQRSIVSQLHNSQATSK